jgi:hypothetical protein
LTITTNASDWVQFEIPLNILSQELPDSCKILLSAGGTNAELGTTLEVDNLQFIGELSTRENAIQHPIAIYPNPFHDVFILDLSDMHNACEVVLYDAHGRTVEEFTLNNIRQQIDLSHHRSGLYTVQINNGEQLWSRIINKL